MQRLFAGSLAVLLLVPSLAQAQRTRARPAQAAQGSSTNLPDHEFGVDLGLVYSKPSGVSGAFTASTPVDVRLGFPSAGRMMWEARLTLFYTTGSGGHLLNFDPGVNVLFKLGQGSGMHNLMGPYFTVGADANLTHVGVSGIGSNGGLAFTVNGGLGTRMPYGSGATRLEGFLAYTFENNNLGVPNTFHIGARVGLSLWH